MKAGALTDRFSASQTNEPSHRFYFFMNGSDNLFFRISGKNLAKLILETTCPVCFKIEAYLESQPPIMKKKIPFAMGFPGVFSEFDSHIKTSVKNHFEKNGSMPSWFPDLGQKVVGIIPPPGWQNFNALVKDHRLYLTGAIDAIFKLEDGSHVIADYKTAMITDTQDELFPLYGAQLHLYKYIAEFRNLYKPINSLVLIYCEPISSATLDIENYKDGFAERFYIDFRLVPKKIIIDNELAAKLFIKIREILDSKELKPLENCPNCQLRERLFLQERTLRNL